MSETRRVIGLGFFDGVHLGHGALLRTAAQTAARLGARAAAVTFEIHPGAALSGRAVPLINSLPDRAGLMTRLYGVEEVLTLPFDDEMRRMTWQAFVRELLVGRYGAVHLVAGYDFRFGYRGEGTPERLSDLCAEIGIGCTRLPAVSADGEIISSSRIRTLLAEGETERAVRLLGHPHVLTGTVVPGRQLGGKLGVPTANLTLPAGVLCPAHGVYAARAVLGSGGGDTPPQRNVPADGTDTPPQRNVPADDADSTHVAAVNVGVRPTVEAGGRVTVEAHLPGVSEVLYGRALRLEFYRRLRAERRFETMDALSAQMSRDVEQTRAYFGAGFGPPDER